MWRSEIELHTRSDLRLILRQKNSLSPSPAGLETGPSAVPGCHVCFALASGDGCPFPFSHDTWAWAPSPSAAVPVHSSTTNGIAQLLFPRNTGNTVTSEGVTTRSERHRSGFDASSPGTSSTNSSGCCAEMCLQAGVGAQTQSWVLCSVLGRMQRTGRRSTSAEVSWLPDALTVTSGAVTLKTICRWQNQGVNNNNNNVIADNETNKDRLRF